MATYSNLHDLFKNGKLNGNFPSYAESMECFFSVHSYSQIALQLRGTGFDGKMKFLNAFINHEVRNYDPKRTSFGFTNYLGQKVEFLGVYKPETIAVLRALWFLDKLSVCDDINTNNKHRKARLCNQFANTPILAEGWAWLRFHGVTVKVTSYCNGELNSHFGKINLAGDAGINGNSSLSNVKNLAKLTRLNIDSETFFHTCIKGLDKGSEDKRSHMHSQIMDSEIEAIGAELSEAINFKGSDSLPPSIDDNDLGQTEESGVSNNECYMLASSPCSGEEGLNFSPLVSLILKLGVYIAHY